MSVSGGGVSAGGGIDLQSIISGGPGFAQRLQTFATAAKAAADAKAEMLNLKAQADAMLASASRIKEAAELQLVENLAKAEELAASLKAADELQVTLTAKITTINNICRE
jgi:hypothetical protein